MTRNHPTKGSNNNHEHLLQINRRELTQTLGVGTVSTMLLGGIGGLSSIPETVSGANSRSMTNKISDPWRPEYHFSPNKGWMNDPNGLIFKNGVYHLFYQAGQWPRRWDYAHGRDLINWDGEGTKVPATQTISPFSGGAVLDKHNSSGFGKNTIVMTYTGHHIKTGIEDQRLAYSTDNGETVHKYEENPIIPSDVGDFRDPSPLWYEPDNSWRLVVSRVSATDNRPAGIEIYSSENLIDWTYESTYGSGGDQWECPNLYQLPVKGSEKSKWLMTVSVSSSASSTGKSVEHHIGTFDGTEFISKEVALADHGYDFYATQNWSNTPQDRGLNLSWMSNWAYGMDVPDNGWRGAMTVPRTISLRGDGFDIRHSTIPSAGVAQSS